MNILDLVGKRALLKINVSAYTRGDVQEYRVLEVSPSGNWAKLMDMNGRKYWKLLSDIGFVEELKTIERPPLTTGEKP